MHDYYDKMTTDTQLPVALAAWAGRQQRINKRLRMRVSSKGISLVLPSISNAAIDTYRA
jgi:hypothetical protein